jgi:hypothetical protein
VLDTADLIAIVTGCAALISAIAGIFLAIRAARSKERRASADEIDSLTAMLESERHQRIAAELDRHNLRIKLAQHGISEDV